jgi:hypothetical protein
MNLNHSLPKVNPQSLLGFQTIFVTVYVCFLFHYLVNTHRVTDLDLGYLTNENKHFNAAEWSGAILKLGILRV